jgi:predicted porin
MNKKLLTLAVASALAVPAIASAEAILYGKVNISLDYIDVQQNATFFRPGTAPSPIFSMNAFKGNGTYDVFGALGSYPAQRFNYVRPGTTQTIPASGDVNNPLLYNTWRGLPSGSTGSSTTAMPLSAPYNPNGGYVQGSQVTRFMNAGARDAYYKVALTSLRSAYPRNALDWAQQAGSGSANSAYYPASNLNAVVAAANANAQASYDNARRAGASVAQANLIAANAYDAIAAPAWNGYQANLKAAENTAVVSVAPQAGYTAMSAYFAGQRSRLTNDLAIGNINQDYFNNQSARLTQLENLTARALVAGAFTPGQKYKGWGLDTGNQVNGPASRVGVKGSEDLGSGLKAVYQIELAVDLSNANRDTNIANGNRGTLNTNSGIAFRNTFVGLAGDWGTVLMGRHDTPLKISTGKLDLFADTLADYNQTIGFQDLRVDNTVAYISPSWSGFQFAAAIVPQNGSTALGALDSQNADSLGGAWSAAAIYKNGPFYGSVAYESLSSSNWETQNADYQFLYGKNAKSDSKVRLGLGLLDWNGFSLTAIYEQRQNILGAPTQSNGNFFQVQAGYAFGNSLVKAMWGRADLEKCADPNAVGFRWTCEAGALGQYFADLGSGTYNQAEKKAWAIGYDYNFSKRTTAYALYTKVDDNIQDADWSGFSIGMMHSF